MPRSCPSPRLATEKRLAGDAAEAAACALLQARGLELLARNVAYPFGEIDLLMRDGACLAFVEVRLRTPSEFGDGADSVGTRKQRKLAKAAQAWLLDNPRFGDASCRFDVVSVTPVAGRLECEWIEDAFTLDDL